jgi:hypothetical protein
MASKVRAAGGASPWAPVASASATLEAVRLLAAQESAWVVRLGARGHDGGDVLAAGLLASLACLTADAAGRHLGCLGAAAQRRAKPHDLLLKADILHARRAGMATRAATDRTFGAWRRQGPICSHPSCPP